MGLRGVGEMLAVPFTKIKLAQVGLVGQATAPGGNGIGRLNRAGQVG